MLWLTSNQTTSYLLTKNVQNWQKFRDLSQKSPLFDVIRHFLSFGKAETLENQGLALLALILHVFEGMNKKNHEPKSRELTRSLTLRVPTALYREIERVSEQERRSVNAQVVYLLYQILTDTKTPARS